MARVSVFCMVAALVWACGGSSPEANPTGSPSSAAPPSSRSAESGLASAPAAGTRQDLSRIAANPKQNAILRLEVTEAGFGPTGNAAPSGRRYYTVGLRGISRSDSASLLGRSKGDDVLVDVRRFVYAQNDRGCISRPERNVAGVANFFGETMTFSPAKPVEGRLVFLVPDDTTRVRVLIAPGGEDGLIVPAGPDFTPSWPAPIGTIEDGSTMRIIVLPSPAPPASLPPPAAGRQHVVLDVVIENLKTDQGIEFQASQQLRLMDAAGKFVQASRLTAQLGCRVEDGDVIPPGHSRRVMAVFDMPAGAPRRLQYRGFERDEAIVAIK
jgi:hypothetical protein